MELYHLILFVLGIFPYSILESSCMFTICKKLSLSTKILWIHLQKWTLYRCVSLIRSLSNFLYWDYVHLFWYKVIFTLIYTLTQYLSIWPILVWLIINCCSIRIVFFFDLFLPWKSIILWQHTFSYFLFPWCCYIFRIQFSQNIF